MQAIEAQTAHHQMLVEGGGRGAKRRLGQRDPYGVRVQQLATRRGVEPSELRLPGGRVRRGGEGPQLKLQLAEWMRKLHEQCGGGDEVWEEVVLAAAEEWGKSVAFVRDLYEKRDLWSKQCGAMGRDLDRTHDV